MPAPMMQGQFISPIELPLNLAEDVPVRGPLRNVGEGIHEATVVCVLVQGFEPPPGGGDPDPVWVEGFGRWEEGRDNWEGHVKRLGRRLSAKPADPEAEFPADAPLRASEHDARGIAIAVAVKDATKEGGKFVPPSIVTLTWCVDVKLVDAPGGAAQVGP